MFTRDYTMLPCFEKADYYYTQYPESLQGPITHSSVSSYVCRVSYPAAKGEFEKSIEAFAPVIPHTVHYMNGYYCGMDSLAWAELYYFKGDLNNAEEFARQAVYRAHEKNQYEIEYRGLYFLLRIGLCSGDYPAVQELLHKIEAQLEIAEYVNRYTIYYIGIGWFYAQIGDTANLEPWLTDEFEKSELNTMLHGFETLVKAKCAFADKRYASVLQTLEEHLENKYGLGSFLFGKLETTLLRAVSHYRLGETGAAVQALEAAYDMALSNALDMPFIELGEAMRDLAGAALNLRDCAVPRPWLEMIRSKASVYGKKLAMVAEQFRSPLPAVSELTWREQEVLRLLSWGLPREEIAHKLALSLNTVKAELSSIYAKLGARNRADAVRIASKLNIFSH
jgi:LuxR family maltose regulon positive regulatory protein